MDIMISVLEFLETEMEQPQPYGGYHFLWLAVIVGLSVLLCTRFRNCKEETIRRVVFWTAVVVAVLEVYKQTVYSFSVENGTIVFDYQWYAFPWQFCSSPMYVGLLTGVSKKGKIHNALCAYLATYALFAGLCVMVYPGDVFSKTAGISFQTMVCHGSMVVIGVWLLATGYVKAEHRTLRRALCVFACMVAVAIALNELTWQTKITGDETFNMFFISPHWPGTLPVYSLVQEILPYPWCLILYFSAFTAAAYLMLLVDMAARRLPVRKKVPVTA